MREGALLLNVSRGGLVDTEAAIDALESGQLGSLGLDVYEHEGVVTDPILLLPPLHQPIPRLIKQTLCTTK